MFLYFPFVGGGGKCRFFQVFFPLSLCVENTSYVVSFRMVFFLPCDHGLDFCHQLILCENSINVPTRVSFFLFFPPFFCLFGDVAFSEYFSPFSLYGEYVVRSFLPDGVFSTL